jgi:hypothetical protein
MMNRKDIRTSLLDNLDFWGSDAGGITVQGDLDRLTDQVAELIATELEEQSLQATGLSGATASPREGAAYEHMAELLDAKALTLRCGG